jgi:hypothetical protein
MPSYDQKREAMKPLFLLPAMMVAPFIALAQTDTTAHKDRMHALEIGASSRDGVSVRMKDGDTTVTKGTFSIDTRYKRITVVTEPKPWASAADSISTVLKDHRQDRRRQFTYWSGVDVGANFLVGADGNADLDDSIGFLQPDHGRSRFVALNLWEQKIEFGSHHAGLLTGLGWEFVNYRLKGNEQLAYAGDSVFGVSVPDARYEKNKLRQMGLRVPLMLEFNTKRAPLPTQEDIIAMRADTTGALAKRFEHSRKHNVHAAFGVVGSWYFDTMYKQRYSLGGETVRSRDKGDFNLLPYRLAASARVGYGALNLFVEYGLTPLFTDGRGPQLTPVTIGLTLVGFN